MAVESTGATRSQRDVLIRFADLVRQLPEPGDEWLVRDVDVENLESILKPLKHNGIVHKVRGEYIEGSYTFYWKTDSHLYELAHTNTYCRDDTGILPCGHDAIKNERGIDGITCGVCGEIHDRSEVDV